jgi:hypothetical protein
VTLGESRSDAAAAGLTWAPVTGYTDKSCPESAPLPLPGFPTVHLSATLGVAVIEAAGAMHTPEGVRIGSTLAEVTKAYPRLTNATGDPHGLGVNSVPVPGNAKASYRIFIATGGTVASVDLMLNGSNCFLV